MAEISYTQMQTLLEGLVRNLDNSETSRTSRSKLDSVINSLDKIKGQLDKNNDTLKSKNGDTIDYSKLSSAIVNAMKANGVGTGGPSSNGERRLRERETDTRVRKGSDGRLRRSSAPSGGGAGARRDGTLLSDLGRGAEAQIKNYGKVASSADILNNRLNGLNTQLGGMQSVVKDILSITGISKAVEIAKTAITERANSYRTMMANGQTFGGDILQMSRVASSAGLSLKSFTDAIARSSMGLKQLGPEIFASTVYQVNLANNKFGDLGLTTQQTSQYMSDYMERLRISGHLQGQTATGISSSFRQIIQNATSLAAAVGTSRDKILEVADSIAKNQNNRALLHMAGGTGGQNMTQYLSQLVNAMGGGPEATAMANAAMKASQGINTPDVAQYAQSMGPAFQQMVQQLRQLGQMNSVASPTMMAQMGNSVIGQARTNLSGFNTRAMIAAGDEFGDRQVALSNAFNDAHININAASAAQANQTTKQTSLTTGALGLQASGEAVTSAMEATTTAALTSIQQTLGKSLTAWNDAVLEGTHKYNDFVNNLPQNSLTRGIDSVVGSVIGALSGLLGPIGVLATVLGGIAAIKTAGALKNLVNTVQSIRHGMERMEIGRLMKERGVDHYTASKMVHNRQLAREKLIAKSGRRGLLGGIQRAGGKIRGKGILGSALGLGLDVLGLGGGGNDDNDNDNSPLDQIRPRGRIERMRRAARLRRLRSLRRAGRIGRLGRAGNLLRTGMNGVRGFLGAGELAEGAGALGSAVVLAPAAVGLGGVGLGAYWNSQSTQDYQKGKISKAQNNINHDSDYGMMGGALGGTATGAMIGAFAGPIGIAAGGIIGGLIGGLGGYGAGHGIGTWANSGTDSSTSPTNTTTTPGVPTTASSTPSDTNVLLQKILDQLTIQGTSLSDQDMVMQRLLQSIDRNTGDTVRQMKRSGNTI